MSTVNGGADPVLSTVEVKKDHVEKPEKPDEAEFKEKLAKAEKEHSTVMEKMVSPRASFLVTDLVHGIRLLILRLVECHQGED